MAASTALLIIGVATIFKVLLFPAYRSTDFEVHRNWLAITHSKPYHQWYTDKASSSEWTVDYPPFFAWFEWALSQIAQFVDPAMLDVKNLNYASHATVTFQRASVIASETVLLLATWLVTKSQPKSKRLLALFLVAAHPGLLIVDHIHFQYNGILLGIFIAAIFSISAANKDFLAAALFSVLLCSKHIFLYAAPAFFIYLLRHTCKPPHAIASFTTLGVIVITIFSAAFAPFLVVPGQLQQITSRLFPVARGLLHAYWAPNFWALYVLLDKILVIAVKVIDRVLLPVMQGRGEAAAVLVKFVQRVVLKNTQRASLTGGLVGIAEFSVLPNISPGVTAACVVCAMLPALIATWQNPDPARFPRCVVYCTLSAFMFGYHVHEKAILMVLLPMAVASIFTADSSSNTRKSTAEYLFLNTIGTYSLFPLLFQPQEYSIKVVAMVLYTVISATWFATTLNNKNTTSKNDHAVVTSFSSLWSPLSSFQRVYLLAMVPIELLVTFILPTSTRVLRGRKLPFLPLMLQSVYCAIGVCYSWLILLVEYSRQLGSSQQSSSSSKKMAGGKKKNR